VYVQPMVLSQSYSAARFGGFAAMKIQVAVFVGWHRVVMW